MANDMTVKTGITSNTADTPDTTNLKGTGQVHHTGTGEEVKERPVDQSGGPSTWKAYGASNEGGEQPKSDVGSLALPLKRISGGEKPGRSAVQNALYGATVVTTAVLSIAGS